MIICLCSRFWDLYDAGEPIEVLDNHRRECSDCTKPMEREIEMDTDTKIVIAEITPENKDSLVELALSMYLGETCPYCLKKFETLEDLNVAVFNGYTEYGRIAH